MELHLTEQEVKFIHHCVKQGVRHYQGKLEPDYTDHQKLQFLKLFAVKLRFAPLTNGKN